MSRLSDVNATFSEIAEHASRGAACKADAEYEASVIESWLQTLKGEIEDLEEDEE